MYRRQFVSPLIKRPISEGGEETQEKRRRLDGVVLARTPLLNLQVPNYSPLDDGQLQRPDEEAFFTVLWRNQTTKKNKTWEGDGVLIQEGNSLSLFNSDGKKFPPRFPHSYRIAAKPWVPGTLSVGDSFKIGNKDVEAHSSPSKINV
jgi:DNA repair and recombination protein RAD54B